MQKIADKALCHEHKATLFTLPGQGYNSTVDYVRMAAAIVIVLFHSKAPLGQFGEAAVGVFVFFMVIFSLRGSQKNRLDTSNFIIERGPRLIKPYLIWTLIYMVMFAVQAVIKGQPIFDSIRAWLPPEGTQRQLWFLPWALLVCVALNFAASFTWSGKLGPQHTIAFIIITIILCPVCLLIWTYAELPLFFAICILYIPSALLGGLAFIFQKSFLKLTLLALASILGAWAMSNIGIRGFMQIGIGVPISILAICLRTPAFGWSKRLNQLSMDVYLVHIAALSAVVQLTPFLPSTAFGGFIVIALSVAIALPLQIPAIARLTR